LDSLKISARNAGQAELKKFCPRCCWYLLRLKKMPFQMGMPGLMFYLEQAQKAFILTYLSQFNSLPKHFGPFANCTKPVDFPFSMSALHKDTGVQLTAQADMMLGKPDGTVALLDLKTSRIDGGGHEYLPQYEIQVIGYSWVAEAAKVGKVTTAGLLYCEVQVDQFKHEPLQYKTDSGIMVPFNFTPHEVELDYSRLTRCLQVVNKIWQDARPPQGAEKCKDCALLTRLVNFEAGLRAQDKLAFASCHELRQYLVCQDYYRRITQRAREAMECIIQDQAPWDDEGGMWANWDFA
jgi:hypothetical protein